MAEKVEVLVDGGKASAGPPLGPALGPLGLNIGKVIGEINEKTKAFAGMKVPVTVIVDPKTKDFKVTVGTPPTSSLIVKELGLEKGPGDNTTGAGVNLTMEQAIKVAKMKRGSLLAVDLKEAVSEVLGSAVSLHIKVDGKNPKEVQKLINEGHYNALLQ
jgi:large subunit ribosomal protein L11